MREPADVVLVSCYEPGHQPQGVASAVAHLRAAGFQPTCLDLAVEPLDDAARARLAAARLVAISVPMHTALMLGRRVAARVRRANPQAHVCFFGLYATLNRALLAGGGATACSAPIASRSSSSWRRRSPRAPRSPSNRVRPAAAPSLVPDRTGCPRSRSTRRLAIAGERRVAGHVEATRGCKHLCRHCPIPPVYGGRFFAVPAEVVLEDVRAQMAAGARHIDFGDPDFLNGPKHALRIARALHAEHPGVTFSFTAKVEHIVAHARADPRAGGGRGRCSSSARLNRCPIACWRRWPRGTTPPTCRARWRSCVAPGCRCGPTFVAFTPWTTLDDYLELCRFIRAHGLERRGRSGAALDPAAGTARIVCCSPRRTSRRPSDLFGGARRAGAQLPLDAPRPADGPPRGRCLGAGRGGDRARARPRSRPSAASIAWPRPPPASTAEAAALAPPRARRAASPPHLTEPWFCCAQPTTTPAGRRVVTPACSARAYGSGGS